MYLVHCVACSDMNTWLVAPSDWLQAANNQPALLVDRHAQADPHWSTPGHGLPVQVERRAIAQANARLSIANWGEAVSIPSALGLSPQAADLLNTLVSSAPVPQAAARWLLNAGMAAGRAVTTAPASPLKALQEAKLQQVFKSGVCSDYCIWLVALQLCRAEMACREVHRLRYCLSHRPRYCLSHRLRS